MVPLKRLQIGQRYALTTRGRKIRGGSGGDRAGEAAVVIYVNCSWADGGGSRQKQEWKTDSGAQQRR